MSTVSLGVAQQPGHVEASSASSGRRERATSPPVAQSRDSLEADPSHERGFTWVWQGLLFWLFKGVQQPFQVLSNGTEAVVVLIFKTVK